MLSNKKNKFPFSTQFLKNVFFIKSGSNPGSHMAQLGLDCFNWIWLKASLRLLSSRLRGSSNTPTTTYTTYLAGFPSKAVIKFGSTDGTKKCGFIFQEYASLPPSIEPQFLNHRFPTPVIVKAARLTPTGNSHWFYSGDTTNSVLEV